MKHSGAMRLNTAVAWIMLFFLVAPAFIAIPVSLTSKTFLSMPYEGLSLRHYEKLFNSPEWLSSFAQSTIIAFSTMMILNRSIKWLILILKISTLFRFSTIY